MDFTTENDFVWWPGFLAGFAQARPHVRLVGRGMATPLSIVSGSTSFLFFGWRMERSEALELVSCIKGHDVPRGYAHFDPRVTLDNVAEFVVDPFRVAHHGFYPFIQFEITTKKYVRLGDNSSKKDVKVKPRKISYASHRDRCIYQYYAHLLSKRYEPLLKSEGIDECVLAYRSLGKSNIHFAAEAFSHIKAHSQCYVAVADFKGFFDSLDHAYLKKMIRKLFEDGIIPDDHYAVLKSLTKYSFCTIEDILQSKGYPDSQHGRKKLNALARIYNDGEMLANKSIIRRNEEGKGIPQGSPMSGLLANIFMIEFDAAMKNVVDGAGGVYRRYSDDVLLVAPSKRAMQEVMGDFYSRVERTPGLLIEPNKTRVYQYEHNRCYCLEADFSQRHKQPGYLTYLGFSFDGVKVAVRERTMARYYDRMRRSARTAFLHRHARKGKARVEQFYLSYSPKGDRPYGDEDTRNRKTKAHRNFHSYLRRASDVFGDSMIAHDKSHYYRVIKKYRRHGK